MKRMISATLIAGVVAATAATVVFSSRIGYESAAYTVLQSEGDFEVREYPELLVAVTPSQVNEQGRDGSFMRLFRYISGGNSEEQKIAMTTPVLMRESADEASGAMSFVMPADVQLDAAPAPTADQVEIRRRAAGRFAVVRFSGRLDESTSNLNEYTLREWMADRGLIGERFAETAAYDPPFTPGPLRRNEVLIRIIESPVSKEKEDDR
ncbi:MAG: heme-binding protein [Planctomycetota bacterium]